MGSHTQTYTGIYLEIPHSKSERVNKYFVSPTTGKRQKNKFDQLTGVENILKEQIDINYHEASPFIEDVYGLEEDTFFKPAYTSSNKNSTFMLNRSTKFSEYNEEIFSKDFSEVDIPKIIAEFKEEYKPYIDYYVEEYGECKVCYGVVNYAH